MADHPNVELLRRGYAAYNTGDMATINELFADDIEWHVPGRSELAGDYHGKDEVFSSRTTTTVLYSSPPRAPVTGATSPGRVSTPSTSATERRSSSGKRHSTSTRWTNSGPEGVLGRSCS
jgi:hypothetical protein